MLCLSLSNGLTSPTWLVVPESTGRLLNGDIMTLPCKHCGRPTNDYVNHECESQTVSRLWQYFVITTLLLLVLLFLYYLTTWWQQ